MGVGSAEAESGLRSLGDENDNLRRCPTFLKGLKCLNIASYFEIVQEVLEIGRAVTRL